MTHRAGMYDTAVQQVIRAYAAGALSEEQTTAWLKARKWPVYVGAKTEGQRVGEDMIDPLPGSIDEAWGMMFRRIITEEQYTDVILPVLSITSGTVKVPYDNEYGAKIGEFIESQQPGPVPTGDTVPAEPA